MDLPTFDPVVHLTSQLKSILFLGARRVKQSQTEMLDRTVHILLDTLDCLPKDVIDKIIKQYLELGPLILHAGILTSLMEQHRLQRLCAFFDQVNVRFDIMPKLLAPNTLLLLDYYHYLSDPFALLSEDCALHLVAENIVTDFRWDQMDRFDYCVFTSMTETNLLALYAACHKAGCTDGFTSVEQFEPFFQRYTQSGNALVLDVKRKQFYSYSDSPCTKLDNEQS